MDTLSLEQAREIVDDLQVINGGLKEETQKTLPEEVLRSFRNLRSLAGGSIRHVAEDLYDTDTRFIFELIQNAEDNHYNHAETRKEEPFIHFTLFTDHITVDTNEDGFTENDVRAICSIHNSSKHQTGGYIGHKGIGFKSVFKVAHKVHIQSGPFCFSFAHRKGESGMGMITPFNEEPENLPPDVRTRFTLFLIQPEDFQTRASELKEIPDTLLLFLRKLCRIEIDIAPSGFHVSFKRKENEPKQLIILVKETSDAMEERIYHVQKTVLHHLPEHDNRPEQTTAEVILAFPVGDSFAPIIEPQYVYSFLPMRQEGFNFLIQSDFITTANRQSVHLCSRNYAIREGISHLFVDATRHFCSHGTLKYEWLQYLPGSSIPDPFWVALREMIFDMLKESKVLLTRKGVLNYPKALQHPSVRHCDRHGQPLLDDLTPEVYISGAYNWSRHADSLTELGVTNLSFNNILDRLDPYLLGSPPRFLDSSLDDDWHTRLADLLLRGLKMYGVSIRGRIERMALIPSSRGSLLSACSGNVYFPIDDQGSYIPEDLAVKVVDVNIWQNISRRKFFEALGIAPCPTREVVSSILRRYDVPFGVALRNSVDHLKYLFRGLGRQETLDKRIFVMDQMERQVYRSLVTFGVPIIKDDLYFGTDGEYGMKQLSQKLQRGSNQQNSPQVDIHIIHDAYLEALPPDARSHGRSWEWWLETMASVRRVPRLIDRRRDQLSTLGQHIADYYPMTLIGILKTYWSSYQQDMTRKIIKVLECMLVPCRNTNDLQPLSHQYHPSKQLLELCSRAAVQDSFDGFLEIPADLITDTSDGWEFLATFGVGLGPDIRFFHYIFSSLTYEQNVNAQRMEGLFRMYEELSIRFPNDAEAIEEIFYENVAVCLPMTRNGTAEVTNLSDCVWNGHDFLRTRHSLALFPEYTSNRHIVYLFRDMLGLSDADLRTYLDELRNRKMEGLADDLCDIYDMISQMAESPEECKVVQDTIRAYKLIYIPAGRLWVAPESCVWAETPEIGGKYGISAAYSQHEDFFREVLSIQIPTAETYVEQLRILASDNASNVSDFKAAICRINALCPRVGDIEDLRGMQFLPVQMPNGNVEILRPVDTFFISDRLEYQSKFRGKAPLLDFSLQESRNLHRLLEALNLEDRYLSRVVEEKTVVEQPTSEPSSQETRVFQRRAKHLYRCALHFNPEIVETDSSNLRQQLQRAEVYESDGFKKTLVLQLNEFTATVRNDKGLIHIDDSSDVLGIYVPRSPEDRQQCYSLHLPNALARFLGLKDQAACLIFQLVFLSPENIIEPLLDGNGIVRIPVADFPEVEPDLADAPESQTLPTDSVSEADDSETALEILSILGSTDFEASSPSPRPFTLPRSSPVSPGGGAEPVPRVSQFVQLLCNVVRLARQATLPEALQVPTNAPNGDGNIITGLPFGVRSESQLAHDMKIGAAGELYVFELLQTLNLPDFGRNNWRSNIRKEVIGHPEYHDLTPWNGFETADLVYHDRNSALTALLIRAGYLPSDPWRGARPIYYMEVKTTTGQYNNPFFMNRSQYQRMQGMQIEADGEPSDEIYMIFRVYHLNKESMGVQIYMDPESLRQDGRLIFTAESYSVRPS